MVDSVDFIAPNGDKAYATITVPGEGGFTRRVLIGKVRATKGEELIMIQSEFAVDKTILHHRSSRLASPSLASPSLASPNKQGIP